jgi:long-chain acyl-CoA synthetase
MTPAVQTIATRIRDRAQHDPHGVALREKSLGIWQETTWAGYRDSVERAAHGLLALGTRAGDRVAIQCENRPEWLVADTGAVAARGVTVGLDPAGPADALERLLRGSGARVLVAEDQEQVDKALAVKAALPTLEWIVYIEPRGVRDYSEPSLLWWPELLERGKEHRRAHPCLLDELAAAVNDDDPVAAGLTARDVNGALADTTVHPDPGSRDFVLCHLPLARIASRLSTGWLNAHAGVQLHFGEPSARLMHALNEVQPSLFAAEAGTWEGLRAAVETKGAAPGWPTRRLHKLAIRRRLGMRKCRSAVSLSPVGPALSEWYGALGIPLREIRIELAEEVA